MGDTAPMRLLSTALLAAGVAAVALTGPASAQTPRTTFVVADKIDDIVSIDPHESFEFSGSNLIHNVYDQLFVLDPQNPAAGFKPGVVESYTLSADGLVYTFKVRDGIKFHSGNALSAADAVYSLQRAVKLKKTPVFILANFGLNEGNVDANVKQTGPLEFTLTVDKPYAPSFVLNCLTAMIASVVDSKLVMQNAGTDMGNGWLKQNSAGSGAFRLVRYQPSESWTIERNDNWWRGKPQMQRVIMRHVPEPGTQRLLVERGDIDVASNLQPQDITALRSNANIKIQDSLKGYIAYIALNQKHPILSKPQVAEAVKWLIDYDGMHATFLKDQFIPHQAFLPLTFPGELKEKPYTLNVAKAKELLAAAGHPNGFEINLDVRNNFPFQNMAEAFQATAAQAGIKVNIIPAESRQVLTKYRARQHELVLQSWGPDYSDPHTNADTFASNPNNDDTATTNVGKLAWRTAWGIPALSAKTAAALLERDGEKRVQMYIDIQREFQKTAPFAIINQQIVQSAVRRNVDGYISGAPVMPAVYWQATKS
jgi:peptide/nickel transport system substrate-binding protein